MILRSYSAEAQLSVGLVATAIRLEAELVGEAAAWAQPIGATFRARARVTAAPDLVPARFRQWSKVRVVTIGGEPARFSGAGPDWDATAAAWRRKAADWSEIAAEGRGTAKGVAVRTNTFAFRETGRRELTAREAALWGGAAEQPGAGAGNGTDGAHSTGSGQAPGTDGNPPTSPDAIDPRKVRWLNTDVSGWKITAKLAVRFKGGSIGYDYDKANVWPARDGVNANPWVFWPDGKGGWFAATFEWFKKGQTTKPIGKAFDPGHIKKGELGGYRPKAGETCYFMVSGLARSRVRNVEERSPIVAANWPG